MDSLYTTIIQAGRAQYRRWEEEGIIYFLL